MDTEWLKFKKYPHIGLPLCPMKDAHWVVEYVSNPQNVVTHKFLPLLHRRLYQRKFRPEFPVSYNPSGKRKRKQYPSKVRNIFYPSHLDSMLYSYYCFLLSQAYEKFLSDKPYSQVAVAYRKIANEDVRLGNKCNIEFAQEAFKFIIDNRERRLSVIIADITSFFDNLDHRLLHAQWKKVLDEYDLPKDHYKVYKSLVNYSFVNENDLYQRFRHKLIVERFKANDTSKKERKNRLVKKKYNMRRENVIAYCTAKDFFHEAKDLIHYDKPYNSQLRLSMGKSLKKGIPQGTPISAILANIYMLDFDEKIYSEISSPIANGFYQRYSDDLIIVCDQKDETYFCDLIRKEIEVIAKLEIQASKYHVYHYHLSNDGSLKGGLWEDGRINSNKQLEYLGFLFNGKKVLVKTQSFSRFYRKMKRSFRRGAHFAKQRHSLSHNLYEWRLYKKFTHIGASRKLRWKDKKTVNKFHDWGNFMSYLNKANIVMKQINGDDSIKNQYSRVWNKFHLLKQDTYAEINQYLQTHHIV